MCKRRKEEIVSRLTEDKPGVCYYCGIECKTDVHHIFEGSTRKQSDDWRLIVHLCRPHHELVHHFKGSGFRLFLHQRGQTVFEQEIGDRDEFIKCFIKSYL